MLISKPKPYYFYSPEQWFQNLLDKMDLTYEPEHTFYRIRGEIYMVHKLKSDLLWYDHNKIYLVLKEKYGLNVYQRIKLIKDCLYLKFELNCTILKRASLWF